LFSGKKRKAGKESKRSAKKKKKRRADSDLSDADPDEDESEDFTPKAKASKRSKSASATPASAAATPAAAERPPTVQEVCDNFGVNDVDLDYTEADYQNLTTYKLFLSNYKARIQAANPKVLFL
jgi:chromodomain-helicase-DNA-binding protein 4